MAGLEGAKVVVAGGAGGVGEGVVRSLLRHGARVLVPSRSPERLRALESYCKDVQTGELLTLVGDLGDEEPARALQAQIYQHFRELDAVVASLGGWWQGKPLTSVDMATWERILRENLTAHFLALKMLVPLLHPKTGSYVHINAFSAEQPFPMAGPVAMAGAAQKSMVLTLAEELKPTGIRVYELILGPVRTRQREANGTGQPDWYTAEEIGDEVIQLVGERSGEIVHRRLSRRDAWQVN
jgi:NAD(P)-dependent dehydrogenase (short-subunit alcohol dehydrogenase family)